MTKKGEYRPSSACNLNAFQHWKIYNLLPSGSYEKGHCALGLSLKQTGAIFQKIPKTLRVDAICNHSKCYLFAVQEAPGVFRVGEIAVRDKNLFASILRQVDEQIGSGHLLFLRNARRGDACMHKTGNTQWKPDSAPGRLVSAIILRGPPVARLGNARLGEQVRLQSARDRTRVEQRLRRSKIIPLAHSSDQADVLGHSSDRTHAHVRVHKREAWPFDRIGFCERDRTQGQKQRCGRQGSDRPASLCLCNRRFWQTRSVPDAVHNRVMLSQ